MKNFKPYEPHQMIGKWARYKQENGNDCKTVYPVERIYFDKEDSENNRAYWSGSWRSPQWMLNNCEEVRSDGMIWVFGTQIS